MARPYEMVDMLYEPPKGSDSQRLDHHLNRWLPEGSKYYGYWGFTIYRTHYSPESNKQWEILLDALTRQTRLALGYYDSQSYEKEVMKQKDRNVPPMYYCKSQEEFHENLKQLKERFRLDTREDPSLDGLGVRELRKVCLRDRPEAERTMAGFKFQYVLLADKAVFEAMDKGEFIIKAVSYTWEDGCSDWGWMRIPTGYLLDLWHRLMLRDENGPRVLPFRGPEEALEEYVWPSSLFLDETGDCSEVKIIPVPKQIGLAKWTILVNQTLKTGVPASIPVAVRIKRMDEKTFTCLPRLKCKADRWTSLQSFFGGVPADDPVLLKPDMKPTNKLMVYDTEELGSVDLQKLSDVTFTTMILDAQN